MKSIWPNVMKGVVMMTALLCAACGWQLQGALRIPAELVPLHVQYKDEHSQFTRALRARLRASGVALVEDQSAANTVLTITEDQTGRRVASVSATNKPTEYEVFYGVGFLLTYKEGRRPPLQRGLRGSQTISYKPELELAKQREQQQLYESMADDMADQIVRQLSTALSVKSSDSSTESSTDRAP